MVLLIRYEEMPPAGLGEQAKELQGKARQEACRKARRIEAEALGYSKEGIERHVSTTPP